MDATGDSLDLGRRCPGRIASFRRRQSSVRGFRLCQFSPAHRTLRVTSHKGRQGFVVRGQSSGARITHLSLGSHPVHQGHEPAVSTSFPRRDYGQRTTSRPATGKNNPRAAISRRFKNSRATNGLYHQMHQLRPGVQTQQSRLCFAPAQRQWWLAMSVADRPSDPHQLRMNANYKN